MGKNANSSSFSLVAFVFFIVGIFYFVIMLGTPGENRGFSFFISIVITIVAGVIFFGKLISGEDREGREKQKKK